MAKRRRYLLLCLPAAALLSACGRTDVVGADFADAGADTVSFDDDVNDVDSNDADSNDVDSNDVDDVDSTDVDDVDSTDLDDGPFECFLDTDCQSGDLCLEGACDDGVCVFSPRDLDDDGFIPVECGGDDCNDLNPNTNPGSAENCFDADDNDCNGVADCFDPVCVDVPNCGCQPELEQCTNGADDDCDTTVDCLDTDCLGTPACGCAPSEIIGCGNGFDDDCDGAFDCDDSDCADSQACACVGLTEQCNNDQDDDCDLLIDCADPQCGAAPNCTCQGIPQTEICNNNDDEDCDGLVDCADPNCLASPACSMCSAEVCDNGQDDDCDGKIDCGDDSCAFEPGCEPTPEQCNNGIDDDLDGDTDCDDSECFNVPICKQKQNNCGTAKLIPGSGTYTGDTTGFVGKYKGTCGGDAGEAVFYFTLTQPSYVELDTIGTTFDSTMYVRAGFCEGGLELDCDDDSAGVNWSARLVFDVLFPGTYFVFVDGFTVDPDLGPNEGPFTLNVIINQNPPEICDDTIDNDGDVYADCADPDCASVPFCATCLQGGPAEAEFGTERCTDGLDNDCDGDVDCDDEDCSASDYYVTECCDGVDENGNGIPDDFNCRCNNSSECDGGQLCYTNTANSCGIPCTSFFGDVCPFVAAGSTCNAATQQCEF